MKKLSETAVQVRLTMRAVGSSRKDQELTELMATGQGGDTAAYSVTKRIFGDHLTPVRTAAADLRKTFNEWTKPWNDPYRIIPLVDPNDPKRLYFTEFEDKMREKVQRYDAAVADFLKVAPQAIDEDKARLGTGWKQEDYPDLAELEAKFGVAYEVCPIPENDFRTGMHDDISNSIREKIEKQNKDHLGRLSMSILANVRDLVDTLLEKIADDSGILKSETLQKILATMETVKMFPVTDETSVLIDAINNSIRAFSASAINYNPEVRKVAKKTFETTKSGLEGIVGPAPVKKEKTIDNVAADIAINTVLDDAGVKGLPPSVTSRTVVEEIDYEAELAKLDAQVGGII